MRLAELVARYREAAGGYGRPLPLAALGLPPAELERELAAFDNDYQISRYFKLTRVEDPTTRAYTINGFACTHLTILPEITEVL